MAFLADTDYKTLITDDDLDVVQQATELNRTNAEAAAIAYFKGFIRSRYDVAALFALETTERDPNLVQKVMDQVLYDLHATLPGNLMPEIREKRKEELDKWLMQIQRGEFQPDWPTLDDDENTDLGNPIKYGGNTKLGSSW